MRKKTIKISLENFYQIHTVHVYILGIAPACFSYPSKQSGKSYSRLPDASDTFAPDCKHNRILLHFELALLNALMHKEHPASRFLGCYFHFTQNFDRKRKELGLKKLVTERHELAVVPIMISALTFEKLGEIENFFELIVEEMNNVADQHHLDSFVFEKTTSYFYIPHKSRIKDLYRTLQEQLMLLIAGIMGYMACSADPNPKFELFWLICKQDNVVQNLKCLNSSSGQKYPKKKV